MKRPDVAFDARRRPLRDLRISVTDRCNFRCSYCMPADVFGEAYRFLPRKEILRFEEIQRLARLFVDLGVRKFRVTGGEPLLRADLPVLVRELADLEGVEDIALTTNGVLLPRLAGPLASAGLRRVTVSLDTLDATRFAQLGGTSQRVADVLTGIDAAYAAGLGPVKVNCVVQRGVNEPDIVAMVERFRGSGVVVRFIEFMDVGTLNGWELAKVVSATEILETIGERYPLEPVEPTYAGEVARRYRLVDGSGEIGVIASVTQPFCGGCTRARLTPEGQLFTCLFGATGTDLRGPLRDGASDDHLRELIAGVWRGREDRYSDQRSEDTRGNDRVEMFKIGG